MNRTQYQPKTSNLVYIIYIIPSYHFEAFVKSKSNNVLISPHHSTNESHLNAQTSIIQVFEFFCFYLKKFANHSNKRPDFLKKSSLAVYQSSILAKLT